MLDLLTAYSHLTHNRVTMIAGACAVFLVNLMIGVYVWIIVRDKKNFSYEQQGREKKRE